MPKTSHALKDNMLCPVCGEGRLHQVVRPETFTYKGKPHTVDQYQFYQCNVCHEDYLDHATLQKFEKELVAHRKKVDGLLSVDEIKSIRQKLGVSQQVFSEVLGGGSKGFARYESEAVVQSQAMDNLLRVIAKYPEAFQYLSTLHQSKPDRRPSRKRVQSQRQKLDIV